jgi:hypothetical protein
MLPTHRNSQKVLPESLFLLDVCDQNFIWAAHLGHHASPRNNLRVNLLPLLLLIGHDRLEQSVQMSVLGIIQLLKRLIALAEVSAQLRGVVILDGRII